MTLNIRLLGFFICLLLSIDARPQAIIYYSEIEDPGDEASQYVEKINDVFIRSRFITVPSLEEIKTNPRDHIDDANFVIHPAYFIAQTTDQGNTLKISVNVYKKEDLVKGLYAPISPEYFTAYFDTRKTIYLNVWLSTVAEEILKFSRNYTTIKTFKEKAVMLKVIAPANNDEIEQIKEALLIDGDVSVQVGTLLIEMLKTHPSIQKIFVAYLDVNDGNIIVNNLKLKDKDVTYSSFFRKGNTTGEPINAGTKCSDLNGNAFKTSYCTEVVAKLKQKRIL